MSTQGTTGKSWWPEWSGQLGLIALLAMVGIYLVTEHTAHVLAVGPYVLLGIFLLLHVFKFAGHG